MPRSESGSDRSKSRSDSHARNKKKEQEKQDDRSCLYIGNIEKKVTQEKLQSVFSDIGPLEYCYIVYEPHSTSDRNSKPEVKQSRGYGFAKYKSLEDSVKAQDKLNGFEINGRKINVEFSKRNKPRESTPGRYLGKKRASPIRKSKNYRRSYSESSSDSHRRRKYQQKKSRRHDRSRSNSRRRRRDSYSRSPRR